MIKNLHKFHLPDLLEIQRASFCWFLSEGLAQELNKFSSILNLDENLELRVYGNEYKLKKPKLSIYEAKEKTITHSLQLYISIEIVKNINGIHAQSLVAKSHPIEKQKVLIGEIPLMTNKATFIINGCERVIVNQLIRSPGVYFKTEKKKTQSSTVYSATVITQRGSWLTFELNSTQNKTKSSDLIWIKVDKNFKVPVTLFLAAMNLTNEEIYQSVKNSEFLISCIHQMKEKIDDLSDKRKEKRTPAQAKTFEILDFLKAKQVLYSRIFNSKYYDLGEVGRLKINKKLEINLPLSKRTLSAQDILKIIDYLIDIKFYKGEVDDIDSLTNRRVRCVGELMQLQVRLGLTRLERNISEKLSTYESSLLRPNTLVNPKPLVAAMKEFFGSSQLSQFMDETNLLAELAHKRRISALGPGGLNTDHVTFAARDIHPTQYGRLCPIETPEGQNAGLIASLASHARLNKYGFLETPFFRVLNAKVLKGMSPIYLSAAKEKQYKIAPADTKMSLNGYLEKEIIPVRYMHEFTLAAPYEVDLIAISPIQIISAAAALIPFLEHDDANRALMGSNMQRQAVALVCPQKPIVGTGLETQIATDTCPSLVNQQKGKICFVTATQIIVESKEKRTGPKIVEKKVYSRYKLEKYRRSNQDTCVNQKPIVWPGQLVKRGQILADGPGINGGELSLGQNLNIAYMPWEGFNYEDAILVSERLVYLGLFTSIHIEKYEIQVRQTKSGLEEMTSNIPNASEYSIRHLDENGLIYKGALVGPGDVLVGKVAPKAESDLLPEGKLLKAIFGEKTANVRDTSLRVPKGMSGRVIDVFVFSKENGDDVPLGSVSIVRIFIAEVRKIKIGDKIAGRHGNKGIISKILPIQDMPYLPDGTVVDVLFNPLGVPSRMNVGQIFECLLGLAGDQLYKRFKILPFDEMYGPEASRILINKKLQEAALLRNKPWLFNPLCPGKVSLTNGQTGENFDNPVLVGKSYILKLIHLVDDKMHARATGPYSLVTQQPVGGKSQQGGQRFGEMEVWALEAFGSAYTLQELLTVKSDDMDGRNEVLNAIVKGQPIPKPGVPESFKVLLRELQALALDIRTYKVKKLKNGQSQAVEVSLTKNNHVHY
jgi:DNA-directed RNA polymerase subunit beta